LQQIKHFPFQFQIFYKKLDSTTCLRVVSYSQKHTSDREQAEKHGNVAVLALATVQLASIQALNDKDFKEARNKLFGMQRLLDRLAQTDEQQEEYDIFIQRSNELDAELRPLAESSKKKLSDKGAKCFYNYKAAPLTMFLAGTRKDISKRKKHVGEIKRLNFH